MSEERKIESVSTRSLNKDGGTGASSASASGGSKKVAAFKRHKFLNYQGYAFPWYATLIWITFFILGVGYLIKNILFS